MNLGNLLGLQKPFTKQAFNPRRCTAWIFGSKETCWSLKNAKGGSGWKHHLSLICQLGSTFFQTRLQWDDWAHIGLQTYPCSYNWSMPFPEMSPAQMDFMQSLQVLRDSPSLPDPKWGERMKKLWKCLPHLPQPAQIQWKQSLDVFL